MIGSIPLHGIVLLLFAALSAFAFSAVALVCLLVHFVFNARGEEWPAASPRFRVLLSAGTMVIFSLAGLAAWWVWIAPQPAVFREGFDNVVLYCWVPLCGFLFLVLYLGLRPLIPWLNASRGGRTFLIGWGFTSGCTAVIASAVIVILILSLFSGAPQI